MAKLVQKSGYIKSGKAGGYMRYIATREGVEKLAGNSAVTKGQRELIQKLLTDFPDAVELFEYEDYCKTPTLGTASAFITMALDANLHEIDSESGYMQYIATRPRVQKHGSHVMYGLWCQLIFKLQFFDEIVHQFRSKSQRAASAKLGNDVLFNYRAVLDIR